MIQSIECLKKHKFHSNSIELEMISVEPKSSLEEALNFYFKNQMEEIRCPECKFDNDMPAIIKRKIMEFSNLIIIKVQRVHEDETLNFSKMKLYKSISL